jgi:Tfp pilus assembly protein PilN
MINLLPTPAKKQLRAARVNVVLLKYCLLIFVAAMILGGVFALGFWTDWQDRQSALNTKEESQVAAQAYASTQKAAEGFAKDLGAAKTILASNISFSQLVLNIAQIVPAGVILNNLSFSTNSTNNTPIDISGRSVSYNGAIDLKNNLEASPIFEKVNIVNISRSDTSTISQSSPLLQSYPYVITIKAQFSKASTQRGK